MAPSLQQDALIEVHPALIPLDIGEATAGSQTQVCKHIRRILEGAAIEAEGQEETAVVYADRLLSPT